MDYSRSSIENWKRSDEEKHAKSNSSHSHQKSSSKNKASEKDKQSEGYGITRYPYLFWIVSLIIFFNKI